ncbi:MAG: ABC transporter ATP-binding protein, partial [Acidimicrobiales bacterium]
MKTIDQRSWTRFGRRQRSAEPRSCSLSIRNLTFTDDDGVLLLAGADLDAGSGTKTCIVGSTGTDQAALLALILGLYRPERGSITVDGVDVASPALETDRESVAAVLADPWLVDGTVADNIAFGRPGVSRTEVESVGQQLGIDGFVGQLPDGYDTIVG